MTPAHPGVESADLDPPYDSAFSDYGNNVFGRRDQEDLVAIVAGLDSQVMMVVKNTPLIQDLYVSVASNDQRFTVSGYSRRYGYITCAAATSGASSI